MVTYTHVHPPEAREIDLSIYTYSTYWLQSVNPCSVATFLIALWLFPADFFLVSPPLFPPCALGCFFYGAHAKEGPRNCPHFSARVYLYVRTCTYTVVTIKHNVPVKSSEIPNSYYFALLFCPNAVISRGAGRKGEGSGVRRKMK